MEQWERTHLAGQCLEALLQKVPGTCTLARAQIQTAHVPDDYKANFLDKNTICIFTASFLNLIRPRGSDRFNYIQIGFRMHEAEAGVFYRMQHSFKII